MKTKADKPEKSEEMLEEYNFDFSKAKPNKYAKDFHNSTIKIYSGNKLLKEMKPVLVEKDIFNHFNSSEKINEALRSML